MFANGKDAVSTVKIEDVELAVATLELAAFEMMYLITKWQSFVEAMEIMESLTTLLPLDVQQLLETCRTVKAKRLFMVVAERLEHPWLRDLDLSSVDFGSGKRTTHPGGHLNKKNTTLSWQTRDYTSTLDIRNTYNATQVLLRDTQ